MRGLDEEATFREKQFFIEATAAGRSTLKTVIFRPNVSTRIL